MTTQAGKEVIYVDVDDEITGIIDKVTSAHGKIVALVLPKRASVFQSIVNMKLLKHRADEAKKHLVLITSEAGLLPLAGSVGVHVARTLQSKPEIPTGTTASELPEDIDEDEQVPLDSEDFNATEAAKKPIGELAKAGGAQMPEETIELDNTDTPDAAASSTGQSKNPDVAAIAAGGAAGKVGKGNKKNKLKIPNFEKFRVRLALAVLALILLIVGWYVGFNVLPKATVAIKTDSSSLNGSLTPTLDVAATSVDSAQSIVPAQVQQTSKNYSQQVPATGQQNKGTTATGNVTLTNCTQDGSSITIPAGTGLSANGLTFITQSSATLPTSAFTGGNCKSFPGFTSATVNVTAQSPGAQYNIGSTTFTVSGSGSVQAHSDNAMSGGTDNIVKVVQQSDIDSAKQKVAASVDADKDAIKKQLQQALEKAHLYAVVPTYTTGNPAPSQSANVGDSADNVTVTENVTYTMFGAKQSDLHSLIAASINQQIDPNKESILDDGMGQAAITVPNPGTDKKVQISLDVQVTVGPHLNVDQLKTQIAGKKSGDVRNIIKANPGVKDVTVHYSPFWVTHMPKKTSKITFTFEKSSSNNASQ